MITNEEVPRRRWKPCFAREEMDMRIQRFVRDEKFRNFLLDPQVMDDDGYAELLDGARRSTLLKLILKEMIDRLLSQPDVTKIGPVPPEDMLDLLLNDLLRDARYGLSLWDVLRMLVWRTATIHDRARRRKMRQGKWMAPEISQMILDRAMPVADELLREYVEKSGIGVPCCRLWIYLVSSDKHTTETSKLHLEEYPQFMDNVVKVALSLASSPFHGTARRACLECLPRLIKRIETKEMFEALYKSFERHWEERSNFIYTRRRAMYPEDIKIPRIMRNVLRVLYPRGERDATEKGTGRSNPLTNTDVIADAKTYILELFAIFSPAIEITNGWVTRHMKYDFGEVILNELIRACGEDVVDDAFLQRLIDISYCLRLLDLPSSVNDRLMNMLLRRLQQIRQDDDDAVIHSTIHSIAMYLGNKRDPVVVLPFMSQILGNPAWIQALFTTSRYNDSFVFNCIKCLSMFEAISSGLSNPQASETLFAESLTRYAFEERQKLMVCGDWGLDLEQWLERKLATDRSFRIEGSTLTQLIVWSELRHLEAVCETGFAISEGDALEATFEQVMLDKPSVRRALETRSKLFQASPLLLEWLKKQTVVDALFAAESRHLHMRIYFGVSFGFLATWMRLLWNDPLATYQRLSKLSRPSALRDLLARCVFDNVRPIQQYFQQSQFREPPMGADSMVSMLNKFHILVSLDDERISNTGLPIKFIFRDVASNQFKEKEQRTVNALFSLGLVVSSFPKSWWHEDMERSISGVFHDTLGIAKESMDALRLVQIILTLLSLHFVPRLRKSESMTVLPVELIRQVFENFKRY